MLQFFGIAVCGQLETEKQPGPRPTVINERDFFHVNLQGKKTNRFESIITSIPVNAGMAVHFIIGPSDGKAADLRIMVSQSRKTPVDRPTAMINNLTNVASLLWFLSVLLL